MIGIIRSNYINLHEIMYNYGANNLRKIKQLVTAVFNASYLCFVPN
jgi:hypothetical protein